MFPKKNVVSSLAVTFLLVLAIACFISTNAYPAVYDIETLPTNFHLIRRELFDPYGFNSILSRFVKRNTFYPQRQIRFVIDGNDYEFT